MSNSRTKCKRDFKRILALADTHCGHYVGLTPPAWQLKPRKDNPKFQTIADFQRTMWELTTKRIKEYGPYDAVIFAGDAIEGLGERSGGTELITPDREEQCNMAIAFLSGIETSQIIMTYGTPYHTGGGEDFENFIANDEKIKAKIGSHEWVDVNGLVFDVKHFLSSSAIPHGRHTAISRARLWNMLWAERELQPKAKIILRAHVHYHTFAGDAGWYGCSLPCLQGPKTKFGGRRCEGTVDVGFLTFDVWGPDKWVEKKHIFQLAGQAPQALVV